MRYLGLFSLGLLSVVFTACGKGGGGVSGTLETPKSVAVNIIEDSVTVEVSKTFQFHYNVSDADYPTCAWSVNDVAGGNSTVGTISNEGMYTAPSQVPNPSKVTIKAVATQDTSKFDTAVVTVSPKLVISPTSVTLNLGATQQFTGNITVDGWRVNEILWGDSGVGTISQSGLYTAPLAVPTQSTVTVSGFSNSQNESATASVTIVDPKAVHVTPALVTLPAGATQQFIADKDVTWSLSGSSGASAASLGTITSGGLYTAPLSPPLNGGVNIVATLKADTTVIVSAKATINFSDASLQGHYVFRYRSAEAGDLTSSAGAFVADGAGGISNGTMMMNTPQGVPEADIPFTGTYQVGTDGRVTVNLLVQGDTVAMRFALISNSSARMMGMGEQETGTGVLYQQDPSAFTTGPSGTYVFAWDGVKHACPGSRGPEPTTAVGLFTATNQPVGNGGLFGISNGAITVNENGVSIADGDGQDFTGDYSFDVNNGSGYLTFRSGSAVYPAMATFFRYYMLSADAAVFVDIDRFTYYGDLCGWSVDGVLARPGTNGLPFGDSYLSDRMVMLSYGYGATTVPGKEPFAAPIPVFAAGYLSADGNGKITSGLVDNNVNGTVNLGMSVAGAYTISSNGRGLLTLAAGGSANHEALNLITTNTAYTIGIDSWGSAFSQFLPQTNAQYSVASLGGHFAFAARGTLSSMGTDAIGQIVFDMKGGLTGTLDINKAGVLYHNVSVTGTYTVDSAGRGTMNIVGQETMTMTIYLQHTRSLILMGTSTPFLGYAFKQY